MTLSEINSDPNYAPNDWICLEDGEFAVKKKPIFSSFHESWHAKENRDLLARVFSECVEEDSTPGKVRRVWNEVVPDKRSSLPQLIAGDGFLRMYAEGRALSVGIFREIWERIHEESSEEKNPISVEMHPDGPSYHGIQATPPGIAAKLSRTIRISKDEELIEKIQSDLENVAKIKDREKRRSLILAILSHGAAYRELHGKTLRIPSLVAKKSERLIEYQCTHHLVGEGVKTISLRAEEKNEPGIYLCQGTEIWPSQPSMIGSIYSNFGKEGSATEPFALSRRLIAKHLRELAKDDLLPYVAGHSMGGALATQISLYLHHYIQRAYAFNPPVVGNSDYEMYHRLEDNVQEKLRVFANIDDFAFWRIGSCVIGKVTLLLGNQRWKYYPFVIWDFLLIVPALIKGLVNYFNAFPSHQNMIPLYENYVVVPLTQEEVEIENADRRQRFGQFHFFPNLNALARVILRASRRVFHWSLLEEYLRTKIEEIDLEVEELQSLLKKNEDLINENAEFSEKEETKALLRQQIDVRLQELEEQKAEFERKLEKYQ